MLHFAVFFGIEKGPYNTRIFFFNCFLLKSYRLVKWDNCTPMYNRCWTIWTWILTNTYHNWYANESMRWMFREKYSPTIHIDCLLNACCLLHFCHMFIYCTCKKGNCRIISKYFSIHIFKVWKDFASRQKLFLIS